MSKRLIALASLGLALIGTPALSAENRCGWLHNPTPGNLWLDDSESTWILMSQGMPDEALGMENIPDFSEKDYVRTNGNYGYACACIEADTESRDGIDRIVAVYSFKQLKLSKCENDRALPKPE